MAQYKVGTVDVTNGSATVTGNSTSFLATVSVGDAFTVTGTGFFYDIASVDSNTQITLSAPYQGVTETTTYTIARDFTPLNNIVELKQGDIETGAIFTRAMRKIDQQLSLNQDAGALTSAGVYSSTSAGISGTTSGDYFFVPESDEFVLYLNSTGSAVEQLRFASLASALQYASDAQQAASDAQTAQTAAESARDDAQTAETNASNSATSASNSASNASSSSTAASQQAGIATSAATSASDDADRAEAAADAAATIGNLYADTTEGLTNTVDGDYFTTPSGNSEVYLDLYRNDAGSATLIASYPSKAFLENIEPRITTNENDIATNVSDITALEKVNTREELLREATFTADFASNRYEIYEGITDGLTERPFNDVFDFTRDSKAIGKTATNKLQEAIADAHRLVGNREGLLIEEERTNLIDYSRFYLTAPWTLKSITATPYATVAPDGTLTGTELDDQTGSTAALLEGAIVAVSKANQNYCASVFVKAGTSTETTFNPYVGSESESNLWVDLTDGSITKSNGQNMVDFGVEYHGDGWYRLFVVFESLSAGKNILFRLWPNTRDTQSATGSVYVWHSQLEEGSFPTSPIVPNTAFTSRSTTATFLDDTGTIQTAAIDVARDDAYGYDLNGTLQPIGLLLEDASTNLLEYSEDLSQSSWNTFNASVSDSGISSPVNGVTYQKIEAPSTGELTLLVGQTVTATVGQILTFSFIVSKTYDDLRYAQIDGNSGERSIFDILEGDFEEVNEFVSATRVEDFGSAWRVSIAFEAQSTSVRVGVQPKDITAIGYNEDYVSGQFGLYTAFQLEAGNTSTSYIPTAASQVTRAADVSSSPQVTRAEEGCQRVLASEFDASEGTLYFDLEDVTPSTITDFGRIYQIDDGTGDNRIYAIRRQSGGFSFYMFTDGVQQDFFTNELNTLEGRIKIAVSWKDGGNLFTYANGAEQSSGSNITSPKGLRELAIGGGTFTGLGASIGSQKTRDVRYIPRALSADELATLTGGN